MSNHMFRPCLLRDIHARLWPLLDFIRRGVALRSHREVLGCVGGSVPISARSRHRRWHVNCAGMDVPVLKMTASASAVILGTHNDRPGEAVILSTATSMPAQSTCRWRCRDRDDIELPSVVTTKNSAASAVAYLVVLTHGRQVRRCIHHAI